MLRVTITKFKRACSLAHVPRILRGDVWCSASNFEKLSAILMTRYTSTTSGSNDDEDKKCKKCEKIIQLAFGPDKPEDEKGIEKIEESKIRELDRESIAHMKAPGLTESKAICEKGISTDGNKELDVNEGKMFNATKLNDEEKLVPNMTSLIEDDISEEKKCQKCKKLIELMFGPDKPGAADVNPISNIPEIETENMAQIVTPGFPKSELICKNENQHVDAAISNKEIGTMQINHNVLHAAKVQNEDNIGQKIENISETPLVEADINSQDKNQNILLAENIDNKDRGTRKKENPLNKRVRRQIGLYDTKIIEEIAKKCLYSRDGTIDNEILKEMKKLGISQPLLGDLPTNKPKKCTEKNESDPSQKTDKGKHKMSRRDFINKRAMKHLALRMGSDNISNATSKGRLNMKTSETDFPAKLVEERNCRTDREILVDRVSNPEVQKLKTEKTELEHKPIINYDEVESTSCAGLKQDIRPSKVLKTDDIEMKDKEKEANEEMKVKEEESKNIIIQKEYLADDKKEPVTDGPAVIVKDCDDPDGFRITPHTPKAETLSDRLTALNHQVKQAITACKSCEPVKNKKENVVISEKTESSKLNQQIERILIDERIPRHLFADLTVVSKNVSMGTQIGKSLKEYIYEQDIDRDNKLIKPERYKYYSHNDEIIEFRDYTQAVDPHVVVRELDFESDSADTDPFANNYSNSNYSYGGEADGGWWNKSTNYYTQYNHQESASQVNYENKKGNFTRNTTYPPFKRTKNSDIPIDPFFSTRLIVNDGNWKSGNETKSDNNNESKNTESPQQKPDIPSTPINPWLDKGTVTSSTDSVRCNAYIDAQEPVKITQMPVIAPKEENLSLSEMLKRVRQRARLEAYKQEVLIASPVTEVDPTEGSCKKPKPPCPPPQKTCPPTPPKCPPSNCPEPQPPCPKPCKPACPDPCETPKCPPAPKKDPCAKFVNQKTIDLLGLVVTLGTISVPVNSKSSMKRENNKIPLVMEDICWKLYEMADNILMPEAKSKNFSKDDYYPDSISDIAFYFPKDYEPWTPIPSWPIPSKRQKKKLVCPQEGCKTQLPPPPGFRCNNIHHPCSGFPNDKKRT